MANKKPILVYDEVDIADDRIEYLKNEEGMTEKEAMENVHSDMDLFKFEFDNFKEELTELIQKKNAAGYWHAEGRAMGWRNRSGWKDFEAKDGLTLLREVCPDTDCTIRVYHNGRTGLTLKVSHHDSPMGEWYDLTPMKACEACDCGETLRAWRCQNDQCALKWDGYEEPSECPACKSEVEELA